MFKYRKLLGSNKSTPAFSKVPEMISLISHHKGHDVRAINKKLV